MIVICVEGRVCCNFHGMVKCYRQMLPTAVTLHSNFLHLVTSSQTALVTQHSLRCCYPMILHYMSVPAFNLLSLVSVNMFDATVCDH